MSSPHQPITVDPDDLGACPSCRETSGVRVMPGKVEKWSCPVCGGQWWITIANPPLRHPFFLEQIAEDMTALTVLQEITDLAGQADALTDGQLRARLIGRLARLDEVCRRSATASRFPAGHRLNDEVPGAPPVPRTTR